MQNIGNPRTIAAYMIILFGMMAVAVVTTVFMIPNINYSDVKNATLPILGTAYQLNFESIPTIANGITAVTSIIVGFTGAIIGIFYRAFKDDETTKLIILISAFSDILPLVFLFAVYDFLLLGYTDFALKMALIALGLSLANIINVMLGSFYRLARNSRNQQNPKTQQPANEPLSTETIIKRKKANKRHRPPILKMHLKL